MTKKKLTLIMSLSIFALFAVTGLFFIACEFNPTPEDVKEISVERGDFTYREWGNASGFPVIMIHGWPESSFCWKGVAEDMNQSFRIIAPDLRGLGDSNRNTDESLYQKYELSRDVIQIIDALGINDFYLVGHDWGGAVSQEIAIALPDRVKKLVLLNIHVITNLENNLAARQVLYDGGNVSAWYQHFQQRKDPNLAEEMIPGNEEAWISNFYKDRPVSQEAIDEYVRAYSITDTPTTGASYYRTSGDDGLRWYQLYLEGTVFNMPLLYIYGNLDSVVIPEYLVGIENFFPSVQVVELESAHFVPEEKPAEVAQAINAFIQ